MTIQNKLMRGSNTIYKRYKDFFSKFVYTDFYLALVCIIVFTGWVTKCAPLGITLAVAISCMTLLAADDVLPLTVNFFSATLLVYSHNFDDYTKMWPLLIPLGLCFVVFLIKNGKHTFSFGKLFLPLLAIAYAMLIGGAGVLIKEDFMRVLPDFVILGLGVPVVYLFFNHYLKHDDKRDIPLYFAKTMMYIGLAICLELITVIALSNEPVRNWHNIAWDLGWGNRNPVATYLICTASMTMYLSTRYRQGWMFLALGIFQYGCLIATFSRGGIIFGVLSGIVAVIFTIIKAPDKKRQLLNIGLVLLGMIIFYLSVMNSVNTMVLSLIKRGMGSSGRTELFKEAWELFKAHPIFGVGKGYMGPNTPPSAIGVYFFHSTFFQVIACMGIVGLAAYAYFYIIRFKILFKNIKHSFNLFCLALLIGFEGYSLLDTGTFIAYPFMALIVIITLLLERVQTDFSGYVTPYNYSTPWGAKIVEKENQLVQKFKDKFKK